jgi:hypothetical protein
MKDFFEAICGIMFFIAIAGFIVWAVIGFVDATEDLLVSIEERNAAKEYCYENGYPGVKWVNGKYYCYNNEMAVPIEKND